MRFGLLGAGLLGGSTVAAWRRTLAAESSFVRAWDPDPAALHAGLGRGILDEACTDVAGAVRDADIVVLACPVGSMPGLLARLAACAPESAIVTDVGSTKEGVVAAARAALGGTFARFVPAHPIAGGERPGIGHADAALFEGRRVITTPLADTDPAALERIEALWRGAGAVVERLAPGEHDRIFAAVSHLPHVLAFALVHMLGEHEGAADLLRFAGAGFADFTRIAASDPVMWRDIALANREHLGASLRVYRSGLEGIERALAAGDAAALEEAFALASRVRRAHPFPSPASQ
jgi:prephenate dehydrogenase